MYSALCTFLLPYGLAIVLWLPVAISLLWTGLTMYQVAGSEYLIPYGLLIANIVVALRFVLRGRIAKVPSPPLFSVIVQDQRGWPSERSQAKAPRVGRLPFGLPYNPYYSACFLARTVFFSHNNSAKMSGEWLGPE